MAAVDMRWLVALLLLSLPVTAQAPSGLEVTIEEHRFSYAPEDWKSEFPITDQASLTMRAADWSASLGARLEVHVRAVPRAGQPGNDWTYEATLSDGANQVKGLVTPDPAGRFYATFDVDGQRALPGMAAVPALVPGDWVLRVRASSEDASGNVVPEGSGQVLLTTQGIDGRIPMRGNDTLEHIALPAYQLPRITEAGPGAIWFNRVPVPSGVPVVFGADATGIVWHAWHRAPPAAVAGVVPLPIVRWQSTELPAAEAGGASHVAFGAASGEAAVFIVTAIHPDFGGGRIWALAASDAAATVDRISAPPPGSEGPVRFGLGVPAWAPDGLMGSRLLALAAASEGATELAEAPIIADGLQHGTAVLDGQSLRAHQGPYRVVAMLEAQGAYAGHVVFERGVEALLDVPVLGEGTSATATVTLRSLSQDGRSDRNPLLTANGTLRMQIGDDTQTTSFELIEGGTLRMPFTFTPTSSGIITLRATVDTGDTYRVVETSYPVLDAEEYAKGLKEWYDPGKYVPGPSAALLLLALALLGRKR